MNIQEIFPKLKTSTDWSNFLTGLIVGLGLAISTFIFFRNSMDFVFMPKSNIYTQKEVSDGFISKQELERNYILKADVNAKYVERDEIKNEYILKSEVQNKYMLKADCAGIDKTQYILKNDVQRDYVLKSDCQKTQKQTPAPSEPPVNLYRTLRNGDAIALDSLEFYAGFTADKETKKSRVIVRLPNQPQQLLEQSYTNTFEFKGHRFTFKILSITAQEARISLVQER